MLIVSAGPCQVLVFSFCKTASGPCNERSIDSVPLWGCWSAVAVTSGRTARATVGSALMVVAAWLRQARFATRAEARLLSSNTRQAASGISVSEAYTHAWLLFESDRPRDQMGSVNGLERSAFTVRLWLSSPPTVPQHDASTAPRRNEQDT
jgi:hypothetical protein